MSGETLSAASVVTAHIDHWDADERFCEELPSLRFGLRQIKRQMGDWLVSLVAEILELAEAPRNQETVPL